MKKTGIFIVILALCLLVAGAVLTTVSVAAIRSSGDYTAYYGGETYPPRARSEEFATISSLKLDLIDEPVTVVRGDRVKIEWSQCYDNQYDLSLSGDGCLKLARRDSSINWRWADTRWIMQLIAFDQWRNGGVEDASRRPVTVTVPNGIEWIEINSVSGKIILTDIDAGSLKVNGVDNHTEVSGGRFGQIKSNGANNKLRIYYADVTNVEINGVNARGEILCTDANEWSLRVNGINATLRLNGHTQSGMGSQWTDPPGATRSAKADGVNAELSVRDR